VVFNTGARAGDRLILTKPLGTGIISTALKQKAASEEAVARMTKSMTALNRRAAELMQEAGVHACTDITGFGLLGHAGEMIQDTNTGIVIHSTAVPYFPEVRELAEKGLLPGGLQRNRDFREKMVAVGQGVPGYLADILFDPQTSGGLLIAVPEAVAQPLLEKMHLENITEASIIGEVTAEPEGRIIVD